MRLVGSCSLTFTRKHTEIKTNYILDRDIYIVSGASILGTGTLAARTSRYGV